MIINSGFNINLKYLIKIKLENESNLKLISVNESILLLLLLLSNCVFLNLYDHYITITTRNHTIIQSYT